MTEKSGPTRRSPILLHRPGLLVGFLLICVLVGVALRAPFIDRAFWNLDEGVTFTIAQQLVEGDVLYRDAVDHRGPLVPYLKAALLAVTGKWNFAAVRLVGAALLGLWAFGLYRLAARLGDERSGIAAAFMFTMLAFAVQGPREAMALHTEWFMQGFSLLGFLVFARHWRQPKMGWSILTGVFFGLAALSKQPGLLDFGVLLVLQILLIFLGPPEGGKGWRALAGSVVGLALPFGAAWIYFATQGAADAFRWYAWTYNATIYVPEIPLAERLRALSLPFDVMGEHVPVLLITALLALPGLLVTAGRSLRRSVDGTRTVPILEWLILGWLAAGWIACGLSGRTFAHYVVHLVPATSLAAGWLLARLWPHPTSTSFAIWPRRLLVLAVGGFVSAHAAVVFRGIDDVADPAADPLREFAEQFSHPDDRWFVWGYYPEVYGWVQRLPATRFNYANFLTGLIPWTNTDAKIDTTYAVAPDAWEQLAEDLQRTPPAVIVSSTARYYGKYPLLDQLWIRRWLPDRYAEVSTGSLGRTGFRSYVRLDQNGPTVNDLELPSSATLPLPYVRLEDDSLTDPLIRIEPTEHIATPATVAVVAGEQILRRINLPAAGPTLPSFLIPFTELEQRGQDTLGLVIADASGIRRSPSVPVARRFDLDQTAFLQEPRLRTGHGSVPALQRHGNWHAEQHDGRWGWRNDGDGSLTFVLQPGQQRLQFRWRGDARPRLSAITESSADGDGQSVVPFELKMVTADRLSLTFQSFHTPRLVNLAAPADGSPIWIGDIVADAIGPVLHLGRESILPLHSEIGVGGVPSSEDQDRWFMHAPARVHYPLRPGLTGVIMRYGFIDDTWYRPPTPPTTGAEFRIEHLYPNGAREVLFSRYMNPVHIEHDRGPQEVELALTRRDEGELHFVIDEGEFDQRSGDWTFLANGRLLGPGPDITLPDGHVLSARSGTFGRGDIIHTRTPEGWWDAHAPSRLVYDYPAELASLTVRFAFKSGAWQDRQSPHITDGIELVVERLAADGTTQTLHRSAWNPAVDPEHRGLQAVQVALPVPGPGDRLLVRTTTGPAGQEEYDWTIWGPFSATLHPEPTEP